jgi:hypothetical protein
MQTRQVERYAMRHGLKARLQSTDFEGERVAIRDHMNRPVIHRPEKPRFQTLVRDTFSNVWKQRVAERAAELRRPTT